MSYPQKTHFLRNWEFTCFENISFAGLKSKFLSTQQKFYISPTHPMNMSSIGLKLMKIEQIKLIRFFSVIVRWCHGKLSKTVFSRFCPNFFYMCVVRSWFFFWRNKLCQAHLLNILIMLIRHIENFLRGCEKKVLSEKWVFLKHSPIASQPYFQSENPNFFTFPNI